MIPTAQITFGSSIWRSSVVLWGAVLVVLLGTGTVLQAQPATTQSRSAAALLQKAIEAQGGEKLLRSIRSVQWIASGYRNELEESERPEGPYITDFLSIREMDDYAGDRYFRSVNTSVYPLYKSVSAITMSDGVAMQSRGGPPSVGTPEVIRLVKERMALNPERLLLTALDSSDAHMEKGAVLQGTPQDVVTFTLDGAPVRIFLNTYTHLPTAVDYSGPLAHGGYFLYLGDVTQRTYYGLWWLAKGGVHLPMQRNVEANGMPDQMSVISKLEINAPLSEADLSIPPTTKARFRPDAPAYDLEKAQLGNPAQPPSELAPGIVFIPGSWNTTLIRRQDGVVVLEAPISSGYSAQIIAEAHKRFPGVPIKAVVTTSDSWPHIAGIREFVAQGVPIYALDLNKPIVERLIEAKRVSKPDALAKSPRAADFRLITQRTTLGSGNTRMEIIPIHGETSERQMMVYFPEHHLLYGSDPLQKMPDGSYFYPQTVTELTDAVKRENLAPQHFFMMHVGPTPWADLAKAIDAAKSKDTPDGTL